MSAFRDVKVKWNGEEYTIPANRMLLAIAGIEEIITIDQLAKYNAQKTIPQAKIAMAYGGVLRFAGARVTDEEVYASMFGTDQVGAVTQAVMGLINLMVPPQMLNAKVPSGNAPAAPANLSKKHTKQRSQNSASSRPSNSGT